MQNRRCQKERRGGFTLLELIVVITILGILAMIVTTQVYSRVTQAKIVAAKSQIKLLDDAVRTYKLDTGEYPSSTDGLNALVVEPPGVTGWDKEGYLAGVNEVPLDPWGEEYYYEYPGERSTFDIYTLGKDKQEGGEGEDADIYNSSIGRTAGKEENLRSKK